MAPELVDTGSMQKGPPSILAAATYLLISVVLFGILVLPHLTRSYLGNGADPGDPNAFFWFLNWWPHAIGHGMNPFITHAVYAPEGINLTTVTSVPAASLVAMPVTLTLGPVAAFNLLMLIAPVLAAWTAFLLCRYVTDSFWPSFAGGYLFGFSTYELAHLTAHLNLSMVFLVPLSVLLVLRYVKGDLGRRAFVRRLALVLFVQFLLSTEVFGTLTLFGTIAMGVAAFGGGSELRQRLKDAGFRIAAAYGIVAAALSPYLFYFFKGPVHATNTLYDSDLANVLIPTQITGLGGKALASVSAKFAGNYAETAAYVGLPLLLLAVSFVRGRRRLAGGRLLSIMLVVVALASLGSALRIRGLRTIPLPWALVKRLPLIGFALPDRFTLYLFLLLGLMAAIWLATASTTREGWKKWGLVIAGALVLLPNLPGGFWSGTTNVPQFFAEGMYRAYLKPGETVLVIPAGRPGADSQLWQIESGMYFRLAGGYLTRDTPRDLLCLPLAKAVLTSDLERYPLGREAPGQLRALLARRGIQTVLLYGELGELWRQVLAQLGLRGIDVGGLTLYHVPAEMIAPPAQGFPPPPSRCGGDVEPLAERPNRSVG